MVIAIGFFDGVHLGHRLVIEQLVKEATVRGEESMVLSFWPHPRNVLQKDASTLRLLSSLEEKRRMVLSLGVSRFEILPFTRDFSAMTAREFLSEVIIGQFGATSILLGYDNRMGSDVQTPEQVVSHAESLGLNVIRANTYSLPSGFIVSSTKVREALANGDVSQANSMLGYDYMLHGVVVAGNKLGRQLGYPTANMQLYEPLKATPANGAYLVRVNALENTYYGMCNIGCRPTVGKGNARTIETHIFDFDEDIYGLDMDVFFLEKIRNEMCFNSLNELKLQLAKDEISCRSKLDSLK